VSRSQFSSRLTGRLAPALLVVACAGLPLVLTGQVAGASPASDLQAEATQLSQQLIQEQLQVDSLQHLYEVTSLKVQQDAAAIASVQGRVDRDREKVHSDRLRLSQEAVSTYINAGSLTLGTTLQLFSGGRDAASNRSEYESVAIGNTTETLALLHTDQIQLQSNRALLAIRIGQDRTAQNAAAEATAQAQAVAAQLAVKQAQVTGQLAVLIAQQREAQAQLAVNTRAAAPAPTATAAAPGTAIANQSLPPFLQCVLRVESGGDYSAVSPDGLYMGAFQFSQSTWNVAAQLAGMPQLIGVPPNTASPADQNALAIALYDADGQQPWLDGC